MTLLIAPCSHQAAKYAVTNWHYSQTMPVGKVVMYGVWEDKQFKGCVLFAWGSNPKLGKQFGLEMIECVELVRVALAEHHAPVSQIVSQTLTMLRKNNPGLRLVVSFADPYRNHHGGIYQAGNWIYLGKTKPAKFPIMPDGTILHRRAFTGQQFGGGAKSKSIIPKEASTIEMPGKHRYVFPLDKQMRRKLEKQAQPYPRADEGLKVSRDPTGIEV